MTLSRCSMRAMYFSVSESFSFEAIPSLLRYLYSVIHSESIPSSPRTCHHRSPPTTCLRSSGPNQSMRRSAALLHEAKGILTGATAAHGGAGTCVFVLRSDTMWAQPVALQSLWRATHNA